MSGTIIYVGNKAATSPSILAALESTGNDVVTVRCTTQAIAMLFVMRSAVAVVVDQRMKKQPSFDMARKLQALRPDVPIVLLTRGHIEHLPPFVTASVIADQSLHELVSTLQMTLGDDRASHDCLHSDPTQRAA